MKVKEFIKKLERFDPDAEIRMELCMEGLMDDEPRVYEQNGIIHIGDE